MLGLQPKEAGTHIAGSTAPSENRAGHSFTGILAVTAMTLFLCFIFYRFLPVNEGWFHYYSWLMHQGKVPYRDFWFFGPPLSLAWSWLFAGDQIINLRVFGLVERILISGMLYFLLSRQFSPRASFLATTVSMTVFMSYLTEGFFTYLVDSFFFLLAGLICFYESEVHPRYTYLLMFAAGAFTSMSFFSKQTTGMLATFTGVMLVLWFEKHLTRAVLRLAAFSAGWLTVAAPVVGWLMKHGAWQPFLTQAFKGAASSKGSLKTVLLTTLFRSVTPRALAVFFLVFVTIGIFLWRGWLVPRQGRNANLSNRAMAGLFVLTLLAMFVPLAFHPSDPMLEQMRRYITVLAKVIFICMGLALAGIAFQRLRARTAPDQRGIVILVLAGFFWAYACQMSYMVEQHAIILGLALLIAAACDYLSWGSGKSVAGFVTVLCLLQLAEIASYKYDYAYDWNGWHSIVARSGSGSHWPELAGFSIEDRTVKMYDTILDDIVRFTKPGDQIFTFPHMPMFNFVTKRPQPTFAPVHYWDVCPDYLARADAERVKAAKPPVMVVMQMSNWLWWDGERTFRQDQRSGQRDIQKAIDELVASGDYRLEHTFRTPGPELPIEVWVRTRP